jgi:hypothetical protein
MLMSILDWPGYSFVSGKISAAGLLKPAALWVTG